SCNGNRSTVISRSEGASDSGRERASPRRSPRFQFANTHSHEPQLIVSNVIGLAKTAKVFGVPTILTTVIEERGGYIIKGLQDVFPDQKPIDRTFINTWQDAHVVDAVKRTGRKKLIMAALWSEIC